MSNAQCPISNFESNRLAIAYTTIVKDSWIHSLLTRDQFQKIDKWIYEVYCHSKTFDPLNNTDYCVIVRKQVLLTKLYWEVVFSPNCFQSLCQIQPEYFFSRHQTDTNTELIGILDNKRRFIFWFGDMRYYFELLPPVNE